MPASKQSLAGGVDTGAHFTAAIAVVMSVATYASYVWLRRLGWVFAAVQEAQDGAAPMLKTCMSAAALVANSVRPNLLHKLPPNQEQHGRPPPLLLQRPPSPPPPQRPLILLHDFPPIQPDRLHLLLDCQRDTQRPCPVQPWNLTPTAQLFRQHRWIIERNLVYAAASRKSAYCLML